MPTLVEFDLGDGLFKKDNHLCIRKKGRLHKFCALCGWVLYSEKARLARHFKGQHPESGYVDKLGNGWLEYGWMPIDFVYLNFIEFLKDPSIELKFDPKYLLN